jgi:hypothetical protein
VQAQRTDFLEESAQGRGGDGGSQSFDEGGVLLERRVEGRADLENIYEGPRLASGFESRVGAMATFVAIPNTLIEGAQFA